MPILLGHLPSPYSDTPTPKSFSTVSPLDPQLFSTIVDHAADILAGRPNAKYSPLEVAQWLDNFTTAADDSLTATRRSAAANASSPQFRRMEEDIRIQIGLGRFFSQKIRSAMLFELYQQTGDPEAGKQALNLYQVARTHWSGMAERAKSVYRADVTYGSIPMRRGHWIDRLAHIDEDFAQMQAQLQIKPPKASGQSAANAIKTVMTRPIRPSIAGTHTPATSFKPGQPLPIALTGAASSITAKLYYRHVNHAERWETASMEKQGQIFHAAIPANYTNSSYPLQYYFELTKADTAWLYPALNPTLSNQPYYAIWKRHA
jgi:hypothetical protein